MVKAKNGRKSATWRSVAAKGMIGVAALALAALGAGGWYLSDILLRDGLAASHVVAGPDLVAVHATDGHVTLGVTPQTAQDGLWVRDGTWGVRWDGGYGQVQAITERTDKDVVRVFKTLQGTLEPGTPVRLEGFALPADPKIAYGIDFQTVTYASDHGSFLAWLVPGNGTTWAIFVHGRNVTPREGLRILPDLMAHNMPVLLISYLNDEGVAASANGLLGFGQTEWRDLEGAVQYARAHGAQDVVLVGFSMGGAIVTNFMYQSAQASHVRALILDAPMLDFGATVDLGVQRRGYPQIAAGAGKLMAQLRFGVNWSALDYLGRASQLHVPILLFHGDADTTVPISTSEALARARSDIVTFERVAGASHVGSWNMDGERYSSAVRGFLTQVLTNARPANSAALPQY